MQLSCFGAALALVWASLAQANWIERSDAHALEVLRLQAQFSPESAAGSGLAEYDAGVLDLGPNLYERQRAAALGMLEQLQKAAGEEEHPRVLQDLQILQDAVRENLESQAVQRQHMLPYIDVHLLLFQSFRALLDARNDAARYPAALTRLKRYVGLEEGYTPLVDLARARTEERLDVPGLIGPYEGQLARDFDAAPRYLAGVRAMFAAAGLEGWQDDFAVLEAQLKGYTSWLKARIQPRARKESTLPPAVYADNLKNFGVHATPEDLIGQAQSGYQFIRSEMKALARQIAKARGWPDASLLGVIRKLKAEQIPQDKVLEVYQSRLEDIEAIIRREGIVTLPKRAAAIRLATEAEAAAVPASFMNPPQLINNTGQYGEFVLVQSNPSLGAEAQMDDWSHDAITWALTVHEARPGHEMQFASLVENGTSLARALFAFNSANVEGWGLYAEAIMHEHLPLEGQLFSLYTRLLRAARMFLDPLVNTGAISRDDAERFLVEQCAMSRAMAASEADRYAFRMPGQATAYYYGYLNLMRLRTEVELALGDAFDQKAFHDFVISQGLLPPDLLRSAVLEAFQR